jgi:hypothetical protein
MRLRAEGEETVAAVLAGGLAVGPVAPAAVEAEAAVALPMSHQRPVQRGSDRLH